MRSKQKAQVKATLGIKSCFFWSTGSFATHYLIEVRQSRRNSLLGKRILLAEPLAGMILGSSCFFPSVASLSWKAQRLWHMGSTGRRRWEEGPLWTYFWVPNSSGRPTREKNYTFNFFLDCVLAWLVCLCLCCIMVRFCPLCLYSKQWLKCSLLKKFYYLYLKWVGLNCVSFMLSM